MFLHEPVSDNGEKDNAIAFKTRTGLAMFAIYGLIYVGFVAINIWKPSSMEKTVLLGLNLAVVYGFGLIVVALIMALIYNHHCSRKEFELNKKGQPK